MQRHVVHIDRGPDNMYKAVVQGTSLKWKHGVMTNAKGIASNVENLRRDVLKYVENHPYVVQHSHRFDAWFRSHTTGRAPDEAMMRRFVQEEYRHTMKSYGTELEMRVMTTIVGPIDIFEASGTEYKFTVDAFRPLMHSRPESNRIALTRTGEHYDVLLPVVYMHSSPMVIETPVMSFSGHGADHVHAGHRTQLHHELHRASLGRMGVPAHVIRGIPDNQLKTVRNAMYLMNPDPREEEHHRRDHAYANQLALQRTAFGGETQSTHAFGRASLAFNNGSPAYTPTIGSSRIGSPRIGSPRSVFGSPTYGSLPYIPAQTQSFGIPSPWAPQRYSPQSHTHTQSHTQSHTRTPSRSPRSPRSPQTPTKYPNRRRLRARRSMPSSS